MLTNEPAIMRLLGNNPFTARPPAYIRATLYRYRFSTRRELLSHHVWWRRELLGDYLAPIGPDEVSRLTGGFRRGR